MKTICLDFDGVIHSFITPWSSSDIIPDPPVPGAFNFIRFALMDGFTVYICSCRFHRQVGDKKEDRGLESVFEWFCKYGGKDLIDKIGEVKESTQLFFVVKKPIADLYIDDRGFQFVGEFPSLDYIKNFKPWNKL